MTTRTVYVTVDQVEAARALRELLGPEKTSPAVNKIADARQRETTTSSQPSDRG